MAVAEDIQAVVAPEMVVQLTYELRVNQVDGDVVENVDEANPLTFISGLGRMLPKFEEALLGLGAGEEFSFSIPSAFAYGPVDQEAVVDLPKHIFEQDGKIEDGLLTEGNFIPMRDASGNRMNGMVVSQTDDMVKMDFNHPLAGDDLFFAGKVVSVRPATDEELAPPQHSCGCGTSDEGSCCSSEKSSDQESCGCDSGCGC